MSRIDDERETRARHGLTRALIQNMVTGVSEGYTKVLELAGVGYRVQLKGKGIHYLGEHIRRKLGKAAK